MNEPPDPPSPQYLLLDLCRCLLYANKLSINGILCSVSPISSSCQFLFAQIWATRDFYCRCYVKLQFSSPTPLKLLKSFDFTSDRSIYNEICLMIPQSSYNRCASFHETQFYNSLEIPSPTVRVGLKTSSCASQVDIWLVLRAAKFHGASDIDVRRTGNPEPRLVTLVTDSRVCIKQNFWAELGSVYAGTPLFKQIMLSCRKSKPLITKLEVQLYDFNLSNMALLFDIGSVMVREMHDESILSCISKAFIQTAFRPRQISVLILLHLEFNVTHYKSNIFLPTLCLTNCLRYLDSTSQAYGADITAILLDYTT